MITDMLINNERIGPGDVRESYALINPATEVEFSQVPLATECDINKAVESASKAFETWSHLTPAERGRYLRTASEIVLERSEEIGLIITMEMGKPKQEAIGEVKKAGIALRYYAEEGERVYGRVIKNDDIRFESYVLYEPLGAIAAITPWNYPLELLCWKTAAALAAGCTVVAKPASITPLSSVNFLQCLVDAGIPPGVVNVIFGSGATIGMKLITHPLIKKVAFTGSTDVGKRIIKICQENMTKYSVELGGQCPFIVCRSSDLELAAADATRRTFRNMGQICIAVNRIYVQEDVYDPFLKLFTDKASKLVVGDSLLHPESELGPMATQGGIKKVEGHVADALSKGARLLCGGKRPEGLTNGFFFQPTILADTNHTMKVMREESFGPIVGVMPFKTAEEALRLANDTEYGLASYVYTNDLYESEFFIRSLQSGNVALNNPDAGVMNAPYGGWKNSGDGYEHGPEGMFGYLLTKHIRKRIIK